MRASARELLVPFFTPLVWCGRDSNPPPPALKADAFYQGVSGLTPSFSSLSDETFKLLVCSISMTIADSGTLNTNTYINHWTKIFQYCTCPAGPVTYNLHCKHMHLSFKSVCKKQRREVIFNITSSSNSFQRTRPTGCGLWEELLVLSRFHS